MKKIKITHLKPEEKNKFIYVHVKVAAITKAKKEFESEFKKKLKDNRLSILYNLKKTEAIIKFYDVGKSFFDMKPFSTDIIKIYEWKDIKAVQSLVLGKDWTDASKKTM
ncbi:MAG TPA: hypothetical protein PKC68_04475 [Alphaproteobacteria bacterium]|nr:hypothetical protein [Alphaproteobacteria bacterium]